MTYRDVLDKYNIRPDPGRGQHFLHNELVVERMIGAAKISEDDTVLEIGAGIGDITRKLAEKAGTVIAYENDETLLPALRDRIKEFDNVEVVTRDFLHDRTHESFDKCVSNIPFHLSSDIIEYLGEKQIMSVLLVQKEFADRLTARPGSDAYSRISIRAQFDFSPVYLETVYDINFMPVPETDAAMVQLYPNKGKFPVDDEPFFFHVVTALFSHSKKKVRNAFYSSRYMFELDKEDAKVLRDEIPYGEKRVFNLSIPELVEITNLLDDLLHGEKPGNHNEEQNGEQQDTDS